MRWVFATVAVVVVGAVAAFAIYTFGRGDSRTGTTVTSQEGRRFLPGAGQVRAVWQDFHAWECPAFAREEKQASGNEIDNSSCEGTRVVSITPVRKGLWRLRVHPADDSAGRNYTDTCYAVKPDEYEPPTVRDEWPTYTPPGFQLLRDCPAKG